MPRFIWLQDCSQYLHSSLSVQASTFPFIPLLPLLTLNLGSFARGFFYNLKSLLVSCLLPKSHFLDCFIIVSVYLPTSFPVMNALLLKCVSFLNNLFCLFVYFRKRTSYYMQFSRTCFFIQHYATISIHVVLVTVTYSFSPLYNMSFCKYTTIDLFILLSVDMSVVANILLL